MSRFGHPSMRKLSLWLETGEGDVGKHLEGCTHCADRLESLADESDHVLRSMLAQVLAAPEQIPERLQSAINERMDGRRDLMLLGELFTLPIRTAKIMAASDQE